MAIPSFLLSKVKELIMNPINSLELYEKKYKRKNKEVELELSKFTNLFNLIVEEDLDAYNNDDSEFEVTKIAKDAYVISGGKVNRLAKVTDLRNTEQVVRFQNILKSMGVFEVLHSYGLKNGDTVICGHLELGYYDDEIWGEGSKV